MNLPPNDKKQSVKIDYFCTHNQLTREMKKFTLLLAAVLCVATAAAKKPALPEIVQNHKERSTFTALDNKKNKAVALFNGKNFDGFYTFHRTYGRDNDQEKSMNVADGLIHLDGPDFGYFCTNGSYRNYYLRVVFRWGEAKYAPRLEAPRDSGILYHFAQGTEDKVWPTSVECQIQENDCGDYFFVSGTSGDSPNRPAGEDRRKRVIRTANFENPGQQWNTVEVICLDDRSEHYVNGHLVNQATNLSVTEGRILFQLEGAEVFYQTIELLQLK